MSLSTQEKKAIVGIVLIGAFVAASVFEIGQRNFWWEKKNTYYTKIKDADGLRVGSLVTLSGLRVGEVADLDVNADNLIVVTLEVKTAVADRIRADAVASVFRAFIIGEKRIELIPGTDGAPALADKGTLAGKDTTDLAEFVTGRKLAGLMEQVETLITGLNGVVRQTDSVLEKYKDGTIDKTITLVNPALENFLKLSDDMLVMTKELKKKSKEMPLVVENGNQLLERVRSDFLDNGLAKQTLSNVNAVAEPFAERQQLVTDLLVNLDDMSRELKRNPQYARQVLDAVSELTVTLKALQRTWFLSDHAKDVKTRKTAE